MLELIIGAAIVISGAAAGVMALRRRRARGRAGDDGEAPRLLTSGPDYDGDGVEDVERPLWMCKAEDVIIVDGRDWLVDRAVQLAEGSRRWTEAVLSDGSDEAWLCCPCRDEPFVSWGRPRGEGPLDPPSSQVEVQGRIYSLDRRGRAVADPGGAEVRFWDYTRPGARRVWHRQEGEEAPRTYVGEQVPRHHVSMLPGS